MATYKELQAQIAALQARADAQRLQEVEAVIADIKAKITEYGLAAGDLGLAKRATRPLVGPGVKRTSKLVYRHPETGETWSGLGYPVKWLRDLVKSSGKPRSAFVINPEDAAQGRKLGKS